MVAYLVVTDDFFLEAFWHGNDILSIRVVYIQVMVTEASRWLLCSFNFRSPLREKIICGLKNTSVK
jgi:hypothetical protein